MKYYLIAGEASGDIHGANLMLAIRSLDPAAEFRFWGGDRMVSVGGHQVQHYRDTAFMGFAEVIGNLRKILGFLKYCKEDLLAFDADALILIDYPGFNIRIAEWAKKKAIRAKIIYYISPQIWAWKAGRANVLKKVVDLMLVILPFEPAFYERYDFEVTYVGHPLLDHLPTLENEENLLTKYKLENKPVIALLPGSRKQEVIKHLSVMLSIMPDFQEYQFVVAAVSSLTADTYQEAEQKGVKTIYNDTSLVLAHSQAALVASGTATLETALMGVPQVVCYKGAWLNYVLAKRLIKVNYISLVNLILDKPLVKELIQEEFNHQSLVNELNYILSPEGLKNLEKGYAELKELLGNQGASKRAAHEIQQVLLERSTN
ncbi:MAG: lipid-A-disaccharide synthase [Saprospiraceae bacterium]|nr:lipid-A-disaccharide synthase [Saprospiraceae bacterium]